MKLMRKAGLGVAYAHLFLFSVRRVGLGLLNLGHCMIHLMLCVWWWQFLCSAASCMTVHTVVTVRVMCDWLYSHGCCVEHVHNFIFAALNTLFFMADDDTLPPTGFRG